MTTVSDPLATTLFGEIFMADQLARSHISKALPKGMELSHFSVLNLLAGASDFRTPAQLAKSLNLTRGAMTNTLNKLEWAGYIHVSPDWDDARRKQIVISPAGRRARDAALSAITPIMSQVVERIGYDKIKAALPVIREIRRSLSDLG
jgi:DNA-binding MarR family transcriptional regulator